MHSFLSFTASSWTEARYFNRNQWTRFLLWFVLFQSCLYVLVALRYLPYIEVSRVHAGVYLVFAYITQFGLIAILTTMVVAPFVFFLPYRIVIFSVCGTAMFGILFLLLLDTTVYALYRFHLNGFIWELLVGPGAKDMFQFSSSLILTALAVLALCAFFVFFSLLMAARCVESPHLTKKRYSFPLLWIVALLISQSMHMWYEARYDEEVTGVTRHLPLYYPATNKQFMTKMGWLNPMAARTNNLIEKPSSSGDINYPAKPLQCMPKTNPNNILVIGIDAMRADVFTPDIMPKLHLLQLAWAPNGSLKCKLQTTSLAFSVHQRCKARNLIEPYLQQYQAFVYVAMVHCPPSGIKYLLANLTSS